jgi:uncharacterized protein (DUF1697 family)
VSSVVLMLRAVNVGGRRVPMPALRDLLARAGFSGARTYLQSGNVVLESEVPPEQLAADTRRLISEEFGFDVPVIVRTQSELERVLEHNPFPDGVAAPKLYWVSFLDAPLDPDRVAYLEDRAAAGEHLAVHGREIYAWLPDGVARSKLATAMAAPAKAITATARNWNSVTALCAMARGEA